MKHLSQIISLLALVGSLAPAICFFAGQCSLPQAKGWMLAATIAWFASVPFWMKHKASD